jgi:hypothetical protein
VSENPFIYLAEAKSADAVLPKVLYQQDFHTIYLAEAKSADAVLPNAAAGASAVRMHRCCGVKVLYQQDLHTIPPARVGLTVVKQLYISDIEKYSYMKYKKRTVFLRLLFCTGLPPDGCFRGRPFGPDLSSQIKALQ